MPSSMVNIEASPLMGRTQAVWSILLAVIPMVYLFTVGCFLFVAPSHFLELLFSCFDERDDDNSYSNHSFVDSSSNDGAYELLDILHDSTTPFSLDVRMARLVGCVLLGQVLSCISLVYPFMEATIQTLSFSSPSSPSVLVTGRPRDAATFDKFRSSVASLSIMGLLVLVAGLVDDRTSPSTNNGSNNSAFLAGDDHDNDHIPSSCSTLQSTTVIASGAVVLILACVSLMFSFWPASCVISVDDTPASSSSVPASRLRIRPIHTPEGDAQVPLLSAADQDDINNNQQNTSDDVEVAETQLPEPTTSRAPTSDAANNDPSLANVSMEDTSDLTEPTSRIRGTTRLLKLAAPQVFYLYVGCAVLLIRLPFSLSIPHFVSTTLGAVTRGDFAGARTEILLLFILGVSTAYYSREGVREDRLISHPLVVSLFSGGFLKTVLILYIGTQW